MKVRFSLLLILLSVCLTLSAQTPDSLKFKLVGPEDFLGLIRFNENAVLIDVRLPMEFRKGHIEKAINIPLSKTGKKNDPVINDDPVLLLYCTTDVRSRWAGVKYFDLGYQKIYILKGGIEAWKRKGLGVEGRKRNQN